MNCRRRRRGWTGAGDASGRDRSSGLMEGLYIKVEDGGEMTGRYKYVRRGFLQSVLDSGIHWQDRPLLANRLRAGVNLW